MTAHSVLNVRAAPEWGNSELYRYYERNGLGYGTVQEQNFKVVQITTVLKQILKLLLNLILLLDLGKVLEERKVNLPIFVT